MAKSCLQTNKFSSFCIQAVVNSWEMKFFQKPPEPLCIFKFFRLSRDQDRILYTLTDPIWSSCEVYCQRRGDFVLISGFLLFCHGRLKYQEIFKFDFFISSLFKYYFPLSLMGSSASNVSLLVFIYSSKFIFVFVSSFICYIIWRE